MIFLLQKFLEIVVKSYRDEGKIPDGTPDLIGGSSVPCTGPSFRFVGGPTRKPLGDAIPPLSAAMVRRRLPGQALKHLLNFPL